MKTPRVQFCESFLTCPSFYQRIVVVTFIPRPLCHRNFVTLSFWRLTVDFSQRSIFLICVRLVYISFRFLYNTEIIYFCLNYEINFCILRSVLFFVFVFELKYHKYSVYNFYIQTKLNHKLFLTFLCPSNFIFVLFTCRCMFISRGV